MSVQIRQLELFCSTLSDGEMQLAAFAGCFRNSETFSHRDRMKLTCWKLLPLTLAFSASVAFDLQDAIDGMDETMKGALSPTLFGQLKKVGECITEKAKPIDVCNFNTSYDPFLYVQECLKGTPLQQAIEALVRPIPTVGVQFGIPEKVSHDRCDCDLVPQIQCVSSLPDPLG